MIMGFAFSTIANYIRALLNEARLSESALVPITICALGDINAVMSDAVFGSFLYCCGVSCAMTMLLVRTLPVIAQRFGVKALCLDSFMLPTPF